MSGPFLKEMKRLFMVYAIVGLVSIVAFGVYFGWEHLPQILHYIKEAWRNS